MNNPLISIIIPVYNAEKYLRQCLDSVAAQTYTNWECLLVDDGSKDFSGSICDEYAQRDSRFKVFHKENGGVSSARNFALANAKGLYVGFFDSDDIWIHNVLEKVTDLIKQYDCDWVRIGYTNFYDGEAIPVVRTNDDEIEIIKQDHIFSDGCSLISRIAFPWLNFFKTTIIGETRFPIGIRFREDAIFLYEMAAKVQSLSKISFAGYLRRRNNGSATFSPRHRDDSSKLYKALADMVERTKVQYPDLSFWIYKDLTQWFGGCPDREKDDEEETLCELRRLYQLGVINFKLSNNKKRALRLTLYVKTGLRFFLFVSLHNILGNIKTYKTNVI